MDADGLLEQLTAPDVPPRGVRVVGQTISGPFDWAWQKLPVPLELIDCRIESPISLDHATVAAVSLVKCRVPGFSAQELTSSSALHLRDCQIDGRVLLRDASIDGAVIASGTTVRGEHHPHAGQVAAFYATRLRLASAIFLDRGFRAEGAVIVAGARIGGSMFLHGATLVNPEGNSLLATDAEVGGSVSFRGLVSEGELLMVRTRIRGNWECEGARFVQPNGGDAIVATKASVGGGVFLNDCVVEGTARINNADIGGGFHCEGARFVSGVGKALSFRNTEIAGDVELADGFHATGEVDCSGARFGGKFNCGHAFFENPEGQALRAPDLKVAYSVFLRPGFHASGQVRLHRVAIGGGLECDGGIFENPGKLALQARSMTVGAGVLMGKNFLAKGDVDLTLSRITGDLGCAEGAFEEAFRAPGVAVSGAFRWRRLAGVPSGTVDLRGAGVGELDDDEQSWPVHEGLRLAGFTYDRWSDRAPRTPAARIAWLRRQRDYTPESYQQLSAVYRANGQETEATAVAMAQQDDLLAKGDLRWPSWWWRWFLGKSLGHGYRPGRAAWALLLLYLVTVVSVFVGARHDAFIQVGETAPQPTVSAARCADAYPCLSVPAYALENITPILNLHQAENWQPKSSSAPEWLLRDWLNLSTVIGYAGTTLLAAGLSGLARRV